MSISRRLPRTTNEIIRALQLALRMANIIIEKSDTDLAFSEEIFERLKEFTPNFSEEINNRSSALQNQTSISRQKYKAKDELTTYISHYYQALNNAIARKEIKSTDRILYGLDLNDNAIPVLVNEAEIGKWAKNIMQGEQNRINNGGIPILMPTADQVNEKYKIYVELDMLQSDRKDKYDIAQEMVQVMMDDAKFLIKNIWDEVEFKYRYDNNASKRRKCREYGVEYISVFEEELTGEQ